MSSNSCDISIVIVNYNVKEYLVNLLHAIRKATQNVRVEVIVVDNNSTDGSIEYLTPKFPEVSFIANDHNAGFGKANNQAIFKASGTYTLLLNPDTLIGEDTLDVLFQHMQQHPNTGAAGCKLLNPDGSFAPESRRTVPTPFSALWKVVGLTRLFPKSKRFGDYYMGWLGEDEPASVPVLSGAFMFFRSDVLKKLGGFDERFFMYGEDIDLSYRTTQAGFQIDYVPSTSIIHYKGESTRKENLDYVIVFNKAMYQFFEKHYSYGYTFLFKLVVRTGIIVRAFSSYLLSLFRQTARPLFDLGVLNALVFVFFLIRYEIEPSSFLIEYHPVYLVINVLLSTFFITFSRYYELYGRNKFSILPVVKTVLLAFTSVVVITFFLRDFAFSRWILLFGAASASLFLSLLRFYRKHYSRDRLSPTGSIKPVRVLIAGLTPKTVELISLIRSKVDWNYEIVGLIAQRDTEWIDELEKIPVIGRTSHVPDLVRFQKIDQLIFFGNAVSNDEILNCMTQIRLEGVIFKIVPESMDFIIGKSNVEYFDDIPLIDVRLAFSIPWNVFLKRNVDFWLSLLVLLIGSPLFIPILAFKRLFVKQPQSVRFNTDANNRDSLQLWLPYAESRWLNRYIQCWYIFIGKISFVGAPIMEDRKSIPVYYKPGLTGLRQLNESRLYRESEKAKYELYYVQNYSIWLDFDIMIKSLFGGKHDTFGMPTNQP